MCDRHKETVGVQESVQSIEDADWVAGSREIFPNGETTVARSANVSNMNDIWGDVWGAAWDNPLMHVNISYIFT
jgi:predicted N-acyltransferase